MILFMPQTANPEKLRERLSQPIKGNGLTMTERNEKLHVVFETTLRELYVNVHLPTVFFLIVSQAPIFSLVTPR